MTVLEKTIVYLKLCTNQMITEGECSKAAKRRIINNMRKQSFKDEVAKAAESDDIQERVDELKSLLSQVDLNITDDDQAA